jgi:glycosyltransferase involved in cell wall biosynthesis
MRPLVSIAVPAYNAESYLAETVRSALAQTYPWVEVIVVNDGSRDGTLAVARSFAHPRVQVIDQENRGAAAARNRALSEAQGDCIQYLDADDLLAPNKIDAQMRRLADRPGDVAAARWGRFTTDCSQARFTPEPFWRDTLPLEWLLVRWERNTMMHPAAWLVPRPVADRAGPWDEQLTLDDDGEYFGRVVLASLEVLFCDDAVSYYRSGLATSLSRRKSPAAWTSQFRSVSRTAARILAADKTARARRACSRAFEEFIYACYPAVPHLRRESWQRVKDLGGPYFAPQMGPKMRALSRVVGWKAAVRVRGFAGRLRRGWAARRSG